MQANYSTSHSSQEYLSEDPRFIYWKNYFHLTTEELKAALSSVNNDYQLLEGFLRKNQSLRGH